MGFTVFFYSLFFENLIWRNGVHLILFLKVDIQIIYLENNHVEKLSSGYLPVNRECRFRTARKDWFVKKFYWSLEVIEENSGYLIPAKRECRIYKCYTALAELSEK